MRRACVQGPEAQDDAVLHPLGRGREPGDVARAQSFVRKARANKVSVLMHISTNDLRQKRAKLPTVAQYRRDVGARSPAQAARRPRVGRLERGQPQDAADLQVAQARRPVLQGDARLLPGCTIVGLDILDQAGATRYISALHAPSAAATRAAT